MIARWTWGGRITDLRSDMYVVSYFGMYDVSLLLKCCSRLMLMSPSALRPTCFSIIMHIHDVDRHRNFSNIRTEWTVRDFRNMFHLRPHNTLGVAIDSFRAPPVLVHSVMPECSATSLIIHVALRARSRVD